MPVRRFLNSDDRAFGPDDLKAMVAAFDCAMTTLGHRDDYFAQRVGRSIVRAALNGERDPAKLCAHAVNSFKNETSKAGLGEVRLR